MFTVVFSVLICAVGASDAEVTLASLVEAHESGAGAIHEIELKLDLTGMPRPDAPAVQLGTWKWASKGDQERIRYISHAVKPRADGLTNNFGDGYTDGTTANLLTNWDPDKPQRIDPRQQGTLGAHTRPQSKIAPGRDAKVQLNLAIGLPLGDPVRYSLAELVEDSRPPANLQGKKSVAGHECWVIHASLPNPSHDPAQRSEIEIYLDPSVNYSMRRIDATQKFAFPDRGGAIDETRAIRDVVEYVSYADGVFVPQLVETELSNNQKPNGRTVTKDAELNNFPEDV